MNLVRPHAAGLVLAVLLGGMHLLWATLVAAHLAQPLMDFIFRIHFIRPPYVVEAFGFGTALLLVGVTAAVGYVAGWCFAVAWNALHPPRRA